MASELHGVTRNRVIGFAAQLRQHPGALFQQLQGLLLNV